MYFMYNFNILVYDFILDVGMKFGLKEEVRDVILSIMVVSKYGMYRDYKVKKWGFKLSVWMVVYLFMVYLGSIFGYRGGRLRVFVVII